jgi:hypothetical protein
MAVILVPSAAGGTYSVRIAGDTPTPQEQANIDAYVAQMDARRAPAEAAAPAGPDTSFRGAIRSGIDQPLENIGQTATMLGAEGLGAFFSGLTDAPENYQSATEGFINEGGSMYDFSYLPRAAVEQGGQFLGSIASRAAGSAVGALAGAPAGPGGVVTGALVGGFAGPAIFEAVQQLGPVAAERAKNNGRDTPNADDWLWASGTAAGSGALNAIAPGLSGFFKKVLVESGTEGLQSIIQQVGETAETEAGLDVSLRQAGAEAILGGTAAGAISAPGALLGRGAEKRKKQEEEEARIRSELDADITEDSAEVLQRIQFGEEADAALGERLGLPAPPKAPPLTLTPEMRVRDEEAAEGRPPVLPLTQAMRDRDAEASGGRQPALTLDQPMRARAAEAAGGRAPALPLTQEMRAREAESAEGRLPPLTLDDTTRLPDDTPPTGGGTKPTAPTKPTPPFTPSFVTKTLGLPAKSGLATAAAKDPAVAGKPITDPAVQERLRFIARAPSIKPEVKAKIEQVLGVRPEAPQPAEQAAQPAAPTPPKAQVDRVLQVLQKAREQQIAGKNQLVSKSGAKSLVDAGLLAPEDTTIPAIATAKVSDLLSLGPDAVRQRMTAAPGPQARKSQQTATQPISAPQPSVTAAAAADSPFGPDYTSKLNRVGVALRKRLTNLGLSDVDLVTSRTIKPEGVQDNVLIEGMMDVDQKAGKRIISLALSVFDPKLSPQQLFDAVARVMDHEVIHALRSLGLFKTAEWNSLSELAARQKYMRVKDGKVTERGYTYLQRAQQMYANDSAEVQVEEAVAEMFRDYVAGRLKIGGRPRTLMDRIKGFFRAIWGSHKETGFTDPAAVFANIRSGDLGRRERVSAPTPQDTARMSQLAVTSTPEFKRWFGNSKVVDSRGRPAIMYHGSKASFAGFDREFVGANQLGFHLGTKEQANFFSSADDYRAEEGRWGEPPESPNVMPLYASIKNPMRLVDRGSWGIETLYGQLNKRGFKTADLKAALDADYEGNFYDGDMVDMLASRGYDGVVYLNRHEGLSPEDSTRRDTSEGWRQLSDAEFKKAFPSASDSYIAFDPGQLKSPFNAGTFDAMKSDVRLSKLAAARAPMSRDFRSWATGPKGEQAIVDASGAPVVYYTGTSKDQDFTKFKVGRHGGWFTTDPEEASGYAMQNDSMGYRFEGRDVTKTNQASRVIPTFLRAANPYRGPLPDFALAQNYKKAQSDWFDSLRAQGYDAWMPSDVPSLMVVLGDDKQVKSVFARGADGKSDMRRFSALTPEGEKTTITQTVGERDGRETIGSSVAGASQTRGGASAETPQPVSQVLAPRSADGSPVVGGLTTEDLDNLNEKFFTRPGWAILTATAEGNSEAKNERMHNRLREELARDGVPYRMVEGMYEGTSDGISYIILADEPTAVYIGQRYDQDSVLTNRGFVYSMGAMPRTAVTGEIVYGDEALSKQFYSRTEDGDAFSLGLDDTTGPTKPDIGPGYYMSDDRPQLPIRALDDKVELHHWSHRNLKNVDPKKAGTGPLNGEERRRGAELGFFGIMPRHNEFMQGTGYVKEYGLGDKEFVALVDPKSLYPFFGDPDGLSAGLIDEYGSFSHSEFLNEYEERIKNAGYAGYYTERISGTTPLGRVKPNAASYGNVAALFYKTPVKPAQEVQLGLRNPPRYSVRRAMTKPLTKAEQRLTVLNRMDPNNGFKFFEDKAKSRTVLQAAQELLDARGGVVIGEDDPDFITNVARLMLAEARAALVRNPGAIGWYGEKVALSKTMAAMLHPEISPYNPYSGAISNSYDPNAEHAWDYAMAVTSNGMAVLQNAKEANKQYEYWKENGRFKEQGVGKQGVGMVAAFKFYNAMKDAGRTDEQIQEFLAKKTTPKELESEPIIKELGIKISTSEGRTAEVYGSYLIGPKIGNGFYQNLRGNFDPLTMDLWFMRMYNRLTGKPFTAVRDELLQKNAQRVMQEFENRDAWTEYERTTAQAVLDDLGIDFMTEENAADFAIKYNGVYQRDFKKFYDNAIKKANLDPKSDEAKAIGAAARPQAGELTLAAKRLDENASLTMADAPSGSGQRARMRAIVNEVRAVMANEGNALTTADFQALMWYAEKQLLASMNVKGGNGGDNDYVDGAIELLRSKGIPDAEIRRVLPNTERERLDFGTDAKRTAAKVRQQSGDAVEAGGGTGGVQEETLGGRQAAPEGDGRRRRVDRRLSRLSVRPSISPTVGRQITARQNELMYARGSDAIARILSKTRLAKPDDAKRFTDSVLRRFQDSMLPVGRMIQELSARGLNITDAMDTYLKEWNYHGITGEKIRANTDRLYNPAIKAVEKLNVPKAKVDQLIALTNAASADGRGYVGLAMQSTDSPKLVLANAYLYAKHARERNRYIQKNIDKTNFTGSGMNDAEADTIVKWFETLDQQNKSAITELGAMVRGIIADTTKQRIEGSLVTPDVSDPYQFYVPLRGKENGDTDTEDPGQMSSMGGSGFGARRREDPRALGRYDYASDVLANVLYQNQTAITRAEKNKVSQSFLNLLRSDPSMTKDYAEILDRAPTERQLGAHPGVVVETRKRNLGDDKEFLVVKEQGVEKFIRIRDPRLLGVLNGSNGMSPGMLAPVINGMSTINRYLASINTSYNPEFMVTNMFRDLQTAGVNLSQYEMDGLTRQVLGNLPSALKGIKRAIINKDESSQWSQVFRDFARAGGQNATNSMNTLSDQMSNIESLLTDISESGIRGQYAKVKNGFVGKGIGSLLGLIENYNTVVENGIRVATYKALIDRGMTKERAAQASRGITVNFAKSGDYRNFMNAFYLFYNASLQGSFALLNAAARSKKVQKLWLSTIAAGILMDQINSAMSPEDEDEEKIFDKMQEHVLEHNLVLMDPFGITPRGYFTIPLPYGLNAAFNTGRSISRFARGEYSPGEATSSMWGTMLDIINPIGGSESFANFASPTVLDPFVDVMQNEDFAGKAIYKENVSFDKTPAPSSQLHWSTTSPSLTWMTQALNDLTGGNDVRPGYVDISPDIAQFWIDFTLGGAGRFVQSLIETPMNIGREGVTEEVWRGIPFARRLYNSISEREDTGAYIERAREVLMAGEELKRARETGDVQWAQETISTYGDQLRLLGPIKSIESQLTKISRMMNQIDRNVRMPEEQKRLMIDKLKERRQELIKRGNALMRQAE